LALNLGFHNEKTLKEVKNPSLISFLKASAYTNNLYNTYRDFAKVESKRDFFRKEINEKNLKKRKKFG
jgi:hypothetical protein